MEAKRQTNPLLAVAAKKLQREHTTNPAKRKYPEETPLGLQIVRAPPSDPRQPTAAGSSTPSAKKFKVDTSRGLSVPPQGRRHASVDPAVERDVCNIDDETDRLRRASRANTTLDPSLAGIAFRPSPEKQPRPRRANPKKQSIIVDSEEPLRDGTPSGKRHDPDLAPRDS
ncbi:hypothetical protein B0H11DRAFT_2276727 [Mycena galericulata]|nr:hypothetical protein B0H11DRAFT_2276727 [Mycena galericulata]